MSLIFLAIICLCTAQYSSSLNQYPTTSYSPENQAYSSQSTDVVLPVILEYSTTDSACAGSPVISALLGSGVCSLDIRYAVLNPIVPGFYISVDCYANTATTYQGSCTNVTGTSTNVLETCQVGPKGIYYSIICSSVPKTDIMTDIHYATAADCLQNQNPVTYEYIIANQCRLSPNSQGRYMYTVGTGLAIFTNNQPELYDIVGCGIWNHTAGDYNLPDNNLNDCVEQAALGITFYVQFCTEYLPTTSNGCYTPPTPLKTLSVTPYRPYQPPQQPYGAQPYGVQTYGAQQYGAQPSNYYAPQQSYYTPQQSYNTPQQSYYTPQQSYYTPQQSYNNYGY